ncbi:MAG: hypothetical protein IPK66_16575 [Rhodospirillales bacterium]|nr:hypothetical protein [Rhodospirillales bacterium]
MRKPIMAMVQLLASTGAPSAADTPPYPIRLRTGGNEGQWSEMAFFIKTFNRRDFYRGGDGDQYDPGDLNKVFYWIYSATGDYSSFDANAYVADCIARTYQRVLTSRGANEAELNATPARVWNAPIRPFAAGSVATIAGHYHCEPLYR